MTSDEFYAFHDGEIISSDDFTNTCYQLTVILNNGTKITHQACWMFYLDEEGENYTTVVSDDGMYIPISSIAIILEYKEIDGENTVSKPQNTDTFKSSI